MHCTNCGNDEAYRIRKSETGRMCCNVCGNLRGYIGKDFDTWRPADEQASAIKWMASLPEYHPNHIDDRTAARWQNVFVENTRREEAIAAKTTDTIWRAEEEYAGHVEQVQRDEFKRRREVATEEMCKVAAYAESEGLTDD